MKTSDHTARQSKPLTSGRRALAHRLAARGFFAAALLAGAALPRTGQGVVITFRPAATSDLTLAANYMPATLPDSTTDVRINSNATALTLSTGSLTAQSLNISTAPAYSIQNAATDATSTTLTLGNTTGAQNNIFSTNVSDLIYLSVANSSLNIQGANTNGGTGTLGLVLANSGNFNTNTATSALTISAAISGNFGVTKLGGGTLNLSGNNTFTAFTAMAGTTNLGANNALGGATTISIGPTGMLNLSPTVLNAGTTGIATLTNTINDAAAVTLTGNASNGGTLNLAGGVETIGSLASTSARTSVVIGDFMNTSTLVTTAGSLTVGDSTSTAFAGIIRGAHTGAGAAFIKQGSGTLTLSGANTFTGGVALNGGTLSVNATETAGVSGPLGTSGTISFGGGVLQYNATNTFDYSPRFSTAAGQTYNIDTNSYNVTFATALTSAGGSLTKNGTGTLTLSGANTFTGGVIHNLGTLSLVSTENAGVSGPLGASGTIILGGGTLQFTATNTFDYSSRFSTAPGQLYRIGTNGQTVTFATPLTSAGGSLTKSGTGTLILSGENTFTGGVTINGGILRANSVENPGVSGPLGAAGTITLTTGSLQFSPTNTFDYSSRFSTAANQNYSILTNNQTVTFASPLTSVGGTLTKGNAGTLILTGANTFTGAVAVNLGSLQAGAAENAGVSGPLGVGGTISFGGGALQYSAANTFDYSSRFSTAANQEYNIDTNGQPVTFASPLTSVGGSLTKSGGTGTLTLNGASTFTGAVNINAGTVSLGVAETPGVSGPLGVGGTISINGGTLQFSAANTFDYSSRLSNAANQTYRINTGGQDVTFATPLTSTGGTLNKLGGGTLVLTGANTFTGNVTLTTGTLRLSSAENPGVSGPLGVGGRVNFNGGTLQYSAANQFDYSSRFNTTAGQAYVINTGAQNVTFATALTSVGGTFTKAGNGVLDLTVGNTYDGGTTVNLGALQASNPSGTSATGSGAVTVNVNGTLQGTGFIDAGANLVTVNGTLSPGNGTGSAGILTVVSTAGSGAVTMAPTSTLAFDISSVSSKDLVFLGNSTLALNGGTLALFLPDTSSTGIDYTATYTLFSGVGSVSLATADTPFTMITGYDSADYAPIFTLQGTDYNLSFAPVPEPSALVGCAALLAGAAVWQGRRRVRARLAGVKLPA